MKKTIALLAVFLAFLPGLLSAQAAKPTATAPAKSAIQVVLAYVDDDTQIKITDASGNSIVPKEGAVLPVNSVIKTLKGTAELQLLPNKSIIKLAVNTTFQIKALKDVDGSPSNDFALAAGKIRAVAAKLTAGSAPGYNISTNTANCGVRGTDFAMNFDPATLKDWVCVQEGQVDFTNTVTGITVPVATGQFANTFDAVFQSADVGADKLAELFSDLGFVKLDPNQVTGKEPAPAVDAPPADAAPASDAAAAPAPAVANDPVMEFLKKFFGLEVGSVTINGKTYSKAVLSPVIAFDSFKLGLYLPIVYTSDMFNPKDWYHPAGNDEWSFGSDKSGWLDKTTDIANDLALKIKYLEWGIQGSDPFYLKIGNLRTMSLGHGTVVRNFANDQDFPAIRKIGLNAGVKLGGFSFEGLADDLAAPSVVGGRLAVDLLGDQIALGLQTTADLKLAGDRDIVKDPRFAGLDASSLGDPLLLVGGIDLQLFKINAGSFLRTTAFADANTLLPYFRKASSTNGYDLKQGFDIRTIFHDGKLGSFGGESGFYGNILIVDYRLSFQVERGLYTNGIFQGNYYRTRNDTLGNVTQYVSNSTFRDSIDKNLKMGVFGSFGFDLLGLLSMNGAYRWPFELKSDGSIGPSDSDYLKIAFTIPKDKIPFVKLSGGLSYERTQFVPSLRDKVDLFDANTILRGEVVYGLAQGMDLVISVSTATLRDGSGNVIYENGKPKVGPTIGLDTKVSL